MLAVGVVAAAVAVPVLAVLASLATPAPAVWAHLARTQLRELAVNTALLLLGVGTGTLALGTVLAWLVAFHEFPGRRFFEWGLMLPLAMPAYVLGFVTLGLLDYAGPLQSWLRARLGPQVALPDPRSAVGVIAVMTLVFYPYVYALARTAFLGQTPDCLEAARSLGCTGLRAFGRVTLPMARPALASGVTLALMEALADFGTVATFGYRTFTEAIYRVWHGMFDRPAATQLAAALLGLTALLLGLERLSRGRARFVQSGRRRPPARVRLDPLSAAAATAGCLGVLLLAFGLPAAQLGLWAARVVIARGLPEGFPRQVCTSVALAAVAAALVTALALALAYCGRLSHRLAVRLAIRTATLGYALPGAVVAVGVLVPLGWLDRTLADLLERLSGREVGLLLTGSVGALVFGYVVRFLAVGHQAAEASLSAVPVSLDEAARALGARAGRTLREIHLPLVWRGVGAAFALVLVEVMKEMPATLLLRPLGLETLALAVWTRTAESLWEEAAVPALALVGAGLLPVALAIRGLTRAPGTSGTSRSKNT